MSTSDDETIANQTRDGPLDETSVTRTLGLSEDEAEPALKKYRSKNKAYSLLEKHLEQAIRLVVNITKPENTKTERLYANSLLIFGLMYFLRFFCFFLLNFLINISSSFDWHTQTFKAVDNCSIFS